MPNLNSRPVGRHVKNSILKKFWNTCVLDVLSMPWLGKSTNVFRRVKLSPSEKSKLN